MKRAVTLDASELMRAERKAGKSYAEIAESVFAKLGLRLNVTTVRRHLLRLRGRVQKRRSIGQPRLVSALRSKAPEGRVEPTRGLDEVETLKARCEQIQEELTRKHLPRDFAALAAEQRAAFKQIRIASTAEAQQVTNAHEDLSWMVSKIHHFVDRNEKAGVELNADSETKESTG